jgi:hypothetical protein
MRTWLLVAASLSVMVLVPGCGKTSSSNAAFTVCAGTYALCTTATCTPTPGQDAGSNTELACGCKVMEGYSAGSKSCKEVPKVRPTPGLKLASRYHPIRAMAVCANSRPWAWCLDMPCTVDADPSKATCLCKQVSTPKQAYIVVTDSYRESTCTTDIWSSAAIEDVLQITGFLQDSDKLKPDPITIVGVGIEKH